MTPAHVDPTPACPECLNPINPRAKRCGSCGVVLSRGKRRLLRIGTVMSALLVVLPLWQLAVSSSDALKTSVAFEIEPLSCGPHSITLSFVNFENDRFLAWSDVRLVQLSDQDMDEKMVVPSGVAHHIAPLSVERLTFMRSQQGVEGAGADTCADGCDVVVSLTAQETDGRRKTQQAARCRWNPPDAN